MSKPKKRLKVYQGWITQEQRDYILDAPRKLLPSIKLYQLNKSIVFYPNLRGDRVYLKNTIDFFLSSSYAFGYEMPFLKELKTHLVPLIQYDRVFNFHEGKYLFHIYKILGFVREAILAYQASNDNRFLRGTIGEFERPKQSFSAEYKYHRKRVLDPKNLLPASDRVSAYMYKNMKERESFTKYLLSFYAIFGVENIRFTDVDTLQSRIMKNALNVFMSGRASKADCANSLQTVLYYYLLFRMKVDKKRALPIVKDIVHNVFGVYNNYSGSELLRNIYVKEVIGSHVIYGFNVKKSPLKDAHKKYLETAMTENTLFEGINQIPLEMVVSTIENPLCTYSLITPSELLQEIV